MKNIEMKIAADADAHFLHQLMNNESVMQALNEVATSIEIWSEAIKEWENDPDEEDYIIFSEETRIGWIGINGLISKNKRVFIKIIALMPEYQSLASGNML